MQHEDIDLRWFTAFYDDLLTWFPDERVEILRDKRTAVSQISKGSLTFFTQDLPQQHSCLLEALECGASTPKFSHLGWLVRRAVESPEPYDRAMAIKCHRQIAHALYKLELPFAEETTRKAYASYLSTEEDLAFWEEKISEGSDDLLRARVHLGEGLHDMCGSSASRTQVLRELLGMTPSHGPGSVATGEKGEQKWLFKRRYASLHARFPYYDWFVARGPHQLLDQIHWYRGLEVLPSPCSKVVAVPKDSRGPRLISEEPLEVQYLQQGYLRLLMKKALDKPFKGRIFFQDQEPNRQLALASSKDLAYATIDLKDASDRVSRALVKAIFPSPIFEDLDALRSTHTLLDGNVVPLRKMSPMGSSVCFPTMAFTLWALCVVAFEHHHGDSGDRDMHEYDFRIFGDDLIVPSDVVPWVTHVLRQVGLKINTSKSYVRSYFRESCGLDAYYGIDVTPTRIRKLPRHRVFSDETYLAFLSYVNSLRQKGWYHVADALESDLQRSGRFVPLTWDTSCYPGILVSRDRALNVPTRWSHAQSSLLAYVPTVEAVMYRSKARGWARMLRNLTQGTGMHPDLTTVRGDVRMRKKWVKASPA